MIRNKFTIINIENVSSLPTKYNFLERVNILDRQGVREICGLLADTIISVYSMSSLSILRVSWEGSFQHIAIFLKSNAYPRVVIIESYSN